MKEILINATSKEIRYAYMHHNKLHDLIIERMHSRQITGNIYRGQVKNILNNIQSAFVDIGEKENGFIHINDIIENKKKFEEMFDMDFEFSQKKDNRNPSTKQDITKLLKLDQPVLVQVVKESIGRKGARLTSNISIAGRYLVLLPNSPHRGVSRKIEDRQSRDRLKKLIRAFEMPKEMGLICRTASSSATTDMLINEATELLRIWEDIVIKFNKSKNPLCLFEESSLLKKAILTAIDKKYSKISIDDYPMFLKCRNIYKNFKTENPIEIFHYKSKTPLFEAHNVDKELDKALNRKVWLPSGGYLYLERTEAMFTIDVNSGKSSNAQVKNVEETLIKINIEAAEEIARQLRIRNAGGLIICDFIDMRYRKNKRRVLDKLRECMKEDFAKCTILGMSDFGLVEMTRQRARESLIQTIFKPCPYCSGNAYIKNEETTIIEIERSIKKLLNNFEETTFSLEIHPEINKYIKVEDKKYFQKLLDEKKSKINFKTNDNLHLNDFYFYVSGSKIDV
ncbi:MAG: Ribonuclease G [Candidatus Anoxychlamydiales bacterium]|nr:Ribonuclease G [Candidatus Anoxychlamydiales bacterium]